MVLAKVHSYVLPNLMYVSINLMQNYSVHSKLHHLVCQILFRAIREPEKNIIVLINGEVIDFIFNTEEKCVTARSLKRELYSQGYMETPFRL